MNVFKKYINSEFGLEAIIAEGNDKLDYRVIFRDIDADAMVHQILTGSNERAEKYALDFVGEDFEVVV